MKSKQEIFDALISEELGVLRAAAYRTLGNPAEVDDAVQEALLIAWNKYHQFRAGAKLSSWVYRITVNHCCDLIRKRRQEARKLKVFAANGTPADKTETEEQLEKLTSAVAELPELYRDSILIGVLSGLPSADAAGMLGCSVNTLYQRIHKAKQLLKAKLESAI